MRNILLLILIGWHVSLPLLGQQTDTIATKSNSFSMGHNIIVVSDRSASSSSKVERDEINDSPELEAGKALYGKIAGLNVYQGTGISRDNHAWFTMHGHTPLVFVDGFRRDINLINIEEIESVNVLSDAVATALYGVQGANGVILLSTKRGEDSKLKIGVDYQVGINTQFRAPKFLDAYNYGAVLNRALTTDNLPAKYSVRELQAFKSGNHPYAYPNVDWWDEVFKDFGTNHQLNISFKGGNQRFKYYAGVMFSHDKSMLREQKEDSRYDTSPTDIRLNFRSNLDAALTNTTHLTLNLLGRLQETNVPSNVHNVFSALYKVPSAAFPVKTEEGIWGGNQVYGDTNPVAQLQGHGNNRFSYGTLLADLTLKQNLDFIAKGLSASVAVAFDYNGNMYDDTWQTYRYSDPNGYFLSDGTLVSTPLIYGKDSEKLEHYQYFKSLYTNAMLNASVAYERIFGLNRIAGNLIYCQQSNTVQGRNNSTKRQEIKTFVEYSYGQRYLLNGVVNYSGTAYLPKHHRFTAYPAISAAWIASNEPFLKNNRFIDFLKIRASYGLSGWDGSLWHELYLTGYEDGTNYFFGDNAAAAWAQHEKQQLPTEDLKVEKSKRFTLGADFRGFRDRLGVTIDLYTEKRSDILLNTTAVNSSVIGIPVGYQNIGINKYRGIDASLSWNDRINRFEYGIKLNLSYMESEVVRDSRGFQEFDYLYHIGDRVGQSYGLEAIGFFSDQAEIESSPVQNFSVVQPGDVKYKDQNGDKIVDEKDIVKLAGSNEAPFYYGFNVKFAYKGIELNADFQGTTGMTVNLLNSPLYKPLVDNGNISATYLNREIPWSYENREQATMPRLSTLSNVNNYQNSSLWYKKVSFLKLRNLRLAYTFPKSWTKGINLKLYVQGTNLFSVDNLHFTDPEQLEATYPALRSYWGGFALNF